MIELHAAGVPISFVHRVQQCRYEVVFDNGTASTAEVRTRFVTLVAADKAGVAAQLAKDAADLDAGIMPFSPVNPDSYAYPWTLSL